MKRIKNQDGRVLSDKRIAVVKSAIDAQLRVRCINVQTTLAYDETDHLTLSSTPFETVPVIHSPIYITDFGANARKQERFFVDQKNGEVKKIKVTNVFVSVHASYHGNGVALFNVCGYFNDETEDYWCDYFYTVGEQTYRPEED